MSENTIENEELLTKCSDAMQKFVNNVDMDDEENAFTCSKFKNLLQQKKYFMNSILLEKYIDAMEEYIDTVYTGQIRNSRTCTEFKEILNKSRSLGN